MTGLSKTECWRCTHPYAWHRPLDTLDLDPLDPSSTPFRCFGHDPGVEGSRRGCLPDCPVRDPDWVAPVAPRDATQAEKNIARAWVDRHEWPNPEMEYAHALKILVFANARPPRMFRRRDHAGLGLLCNVCHGPCSIDGLVSP